MNAKKKLYLHIGTHKTGSTALQVFFSQNRDNLAKNGILYPKVGCPEYSHYGQHLIAWSFFENQNYLPSFNGNILNKSFIAKMHLIEELNLVSNDDSINTVILSSEEFSVLNESEIEKLAKSLFNFDVEIIIYFRRQDNYLEASYKTSVLYSAYEKNFISFMDNQRMNLNYDSVIRNWEKSFGKNIHVRSYEKTEIKQNIVLDFCNLIGLRINNNYSISNNRENESISADAVEVIRGLRLRGWSEERLSNLRTIFGHMYKSSSKEMLGGFINETNYNKIKNLYTNDFLSDEYNCPLEFHQDYKNKNTVVDFEESLVNSFSDLIIFNQKNKG